MASFIGTIDEFIKYINPRAKNVVNSITRRYKTEVGSCQHCGTATETLEAAHITGRERPIIIEEILSNFTNGEIITIDLEVFENKFLEAHDPINECILVLCRQCHTAYDNNPQANQIAVENTEENNEQLITNSEITEYLRNNVPNLSSEEIEHLQSLEYCNNTFRINYPVLKEVPINSTTQEIQGYARINGYNRWSTQRPIVIGEKMYLVVTQWTNLHRQHFINWRERIENA